MLARTSIGHALVAPAGAARPVPIVPTVRLVPSPRTTGAPLDIPLRPGDNSCTYEATRRLVLAHGRANSSLRLPADIDLEQPLPGFDSIASALEDLAAGKLVVVLDDEDRENEGDLIMNADKVTTETMAFLVEYTSGVVCIAMEGSDLDRLRLPLMISSAENEESMYTAFTVTVDLREGISTGISASDRAKTIRRLADPTATSSDFRKPGHIFPLRYRPGGVLVRPGHTEAGVDLARLSGSFPAGVLCELVNKEDGSMARTPQLLDFAKRHGLRCITIADLIRYRLRHDPLITPSGNPVPLTTRSGLGLTAHCFRSLIDETEHLAFVHGHLPDPSASPSSPEVLLHLHHERTVADLLDCSEPGPSSNGNGSNGITANGASHASPTSSLDAALHGISSHAAPGVVVYLRGQTARAVPLANELAALAKYGSSRGLYDTDIRDAALVAQMLRGLGVSSVVLAAGDAAMAQALRSCGLSVRLAATSSSWSLPPSSSTPSYSANGRGPLHGGPPPLHTAGMR